MKKINIRKGYNVKKLSLFNNHSDYFNYLIQINVLPSETYYKNEKKYSGIPLLYNIIRQLLKDNQEEVVDKIIEQTNLNEQSSYSGRTPLFSFAESEIGENYDVFFYLNKIHIDLSQQDKEGNTIFQILVDNFEEKSVEETIEFIKKFELCWFEIKNNKGITALERVYAYEDEQSKLMTSFNHLKYMQEEKKIIEKNIICVDKQPSTKKRL